MYYQAPGEAESFKTSYYKSFLNGFKISDTDQLILALIFRFGVILAYKMDVKFSGVFVRY